MSEFVDWSDPAAIAHHQKAIATHPNHLLHRWRLGLSWLLNGEVETAQDIWLAAIEGLSAEAIAPATTELQELLQSTAEEQFRAGNYRHTLTLYEQILEVVPDLETNQTIHAYLRIGDALAQFGNYEEALECWQGVLILQPNCAEVYARSMAVYRGLGEWEAVITTAEAMLQIEPDSLEAHQTLGFFYAQQNNWQQASAHFRHADDSANFAYSLLQLSDFDGAVKTLQTTAQHLTPLRSDSQPPTTLHLLTLLQQQSIEVYRLLAKVLLERGMFLGAIALNLRILEEVGDLETHYLNLGRAFVGVQQFDHALQAYQDAIHANQTLPEAYLEWGKLSTTLGDFSTAHSAFQIAQELRSDWAELDLRWAQLWAKQQRWKEAIAHYTRYLEQQPRDAVSRCNLAIALAQIGERAGAIAQFNQALQINNNLAPQIWHWMTDLQQNDSLAETDPGFVETLPIDPPADFYATTQEWISDVTLTKLLEPGRVQSEADLPEEFWALHSLETLVLKPPKTPTGDIHFSFRFGEEITLPESFVTIIPGGRFWIDPDLSSSAIVTAENYLLSDLSPEFPVLSPGHPDRQPDKHWLFVVEKLPPVQRVNGTVAVLAGLSNNVYFHWMFDLLPRIELLKEAKIDLDSIDYFLTGNQLPFQQETLEKLGIPSHKVLQLEEYMHLGGDRLIVPSFPGTVAWMPTWVCQWLREIFLPSGGKIQPPTKRLYISRSRTKNRRILNEEQILPILQNAGFEVVYLESMSVAEQAYLFASTEVIVGAHGSGLTNLVFCQSGTKVIEIFSPNFVYSCYWLVSNLSKLNYYYILGELPLGFYFNQLLYPEARVEDIWVDGDRLQSMLKFAEVV